jgi:SpoVK/Ycf46/Vps4 family AAA+-type ATPase
MLLYGPPGTGKTTVAENIADHLRPNLLERNAKTIFDVLEAQTDCVVLFDEIDSFLLDRDSKRHEKQDTTFQFMTPSMLTKLNDLRRAERSIFIVATNYESRIDSAIKRTGRIDIKYLLLPPDKGVRRRILTDLMNKKWNTTPVISDDTWKELEQASLFLGYRDIQAEVGSHRDNAALAKGLQNHARTTRLEPYRAKFDNDSDSQTPKTEFLAMIKLALEVDDLRALYNESKPSDLAIAAAKALKLTKGDAAASVIEAANNQRADAVIG